MKIKTMARFARLGVYGVLSGIGPRTAVAYGARMDEYLVQAQAMGYCREFALDLIRQGWGMERALSVMASGEFPR